VRAESRGNRGDYRLDKGHFSAGGQADVFQAEHKTTGIVVAFKRLRQSRNAEGVARMRREIQVGTSIDHPNLMPILDADVDATWLVMPLALDNLEARPEEVVQSDELAPLIGQICACLAAAHVHGWVQDAFGRRAIIERAKGILMERHRIDEQQAFELLRQDSRDHGRKLIEIAQAVTDSCRLLTDNQPPGTPTSIRTDQRRRASLD
jgi:hypothetical protein